MGPYLLAWMGMGPYLLTCLLGWVLCIAVSLLLGNHLFFRAYWEPLSCSVWVGDLGISSPTEHEAVFGAVIVLVRDRRIESLEEGVRENVVVGKRVSKWCWRT